MHSHLSLSRRSVLRAASAAFAAAAVSHPVFAAAAAPVRERSIAEVIRMSPVEMAEESAVVRAAMTSLEASAKRLSDAKLAGVILDIMKNPMPRLLEGIDEAQCLEALRREGLVDAKRSSLFPPLADRSAAPQPYASAPGSGYKSHHAYPGGLATHCALNVASAEKLADSYREVFGLEIDRDAAVGGELLHDLHKPWVFQWLKDHTCRVEPQLAGTGEHHVLSIAESMKRGVAPAVCVAQACAHDHPGTAESEARVVKYLRAAAIIAGVDPVRGGYLAADGKTLPQPRRMEGFVVHLADHDFVVSGPACQWTAAALYELFREQYGLTSEADLNAARNYAFANLTAMRLYGVLSTRGKRALGEEVARIVKKA